MGSSKFSSRPQTSSRSIANRPPTNHSPPRSPAAFLVQSIINTPVFFILVYQYTHVNIHHHRIRGVVGYHVCFTISSEIRSYKVPGSNPRDFTSLASSSFVLITLVHVHPPVAGRWWFKVLVVNPNLGRVLVGNPNRAFWRSSRALFPELTMQPLQHHVHLSHHLM